jgi:hypothetical protein
VLLKESPCKYTNALASSGEEAILRKINKLNKKVLFISAYLSPKIRMQLDMLCSNVPIFKMAEVNSYFIEFNVIPLLDHQVREGRGFQVLTKHYNAAYYRRNRR